MFINPSEKEKPAKPKWAAIGKVFASIPLNINALDRAMHRAWGLHQNVRFMNLVITTSWSNSVVKEIGSMR